MEYTFRNKHDEVGYTLEIRKIKPYYISWTLYRNGSDGLEQMLTGSTKWDGCSDMQTQDGFFAHFCELDEWKEFGLVMEWVYRTAYGLVENRDGELDV